ncbi:MAG: type I-U CRISPR-associated helicase/endonuclease Cas3 [Myxococcales bacterium]|nr:type I-U CRISPR-associated helicase/endonuclease Cas3 [Myxococcales bacterium]
MLTASDFTAFFSAVHGHAPFPWQERLLLEVVARGEWPSLLDLPTGSGKTAAMDVAVFHMALEGSKKIAERKAPRRIVFVVDRRVVVDQAFTRARTLADALTRPQHDAVRAVADALSKLSYGKTPLACAMLRGGMPRDTSWLRAPDQPLIVVSTVDQVGSRLLFRGYGVTDGMLPVHAGLFAEDALFLLDEVHLSQPFEQTLDAVKKYRSFAERGLRAPFQVVPLSATAANLGDRPFPLGPDDRDPKKAPKLVQRLEAKKPVRLVEEKVKGSEPERKATLATALVREAEACATAGAKTILIVVNQVDTARRVLACLRDRGVAALGDKASRVSAIVTGRMRPLDQMDAYAALAPWIEAGRDPREPEPKTLFLVATQCIEAGADLDCDALVTECASIDALKQRFGRIDRLGELGTRALGVIVARSDVASGKGERADPIYGPAACATWAWLRKNERGLDFGIDAFPELPREELAAMAAERADAPYLLPAHLDAFAQTSPRPAIEPAPSLWLHGPKRDTAEVTFVWREDVLAAELSACHERGGSRRDEEQRAGVLERLRERIEFVPPSTLESLTVPLGAALAWFRAHREPPVADVDVLNDESDEHQPPPVRPKLALRWRGDESTVIDAGAMRPGDVLVVPSAYGGLSGGVWDPSATEAVAELGDRAQLVQRGHAVVRPGIGGLPSLTAKARARLVELLGERRISEALALVQDPQGDAETPSLPAWRSIAFTLLLRRRAPVTVLDQENSLAFGRRSSRDDIALVVNALCEQAKRPDLAAEMETERFSTDPETSAFTGAPVLLAKHSNSVERVARGFAERLGLNDALISDLALAGYLHDQGKADPRFQAWLRDGNRFLVDAGAPLLAKSAKRSEDRAARRATLLASKYPKGARHEMLSVALVEGDSEIRKKASDWDLVLHLVASHHGHARPFAPAIEDSAPERVTIHFARAGQSRELSASSDSDLAALDSGVPERFWRLTRTYGWFGLAWLEAILRLADHRASDDDDYDSERAANKAEEDAS